MVITKKCIHHSWHKISNSNSWFFKRIEYFLFYDLSEQYKLYIWIILLFSIEYTILCIQYFILDWPILNYSLFYSLFSNQLFSSTLPHPTHPYSTPYLTLNPSFMPFSIILSSSPVHPHPRGTRLNLANLLSSIPFKSNENKHVWQWRRDQDYCRAHLYDSHCQTSCWKEIMQEGFQAR